MANHDSAQILPAVEADLETLANIHSISYLPELVMAFFFKDWPNPEPFNVLYTARLSQRFKDPKSQVFKIKDTSSNEILGLVCLTLVDAQEGEEAKKNELSLENIREHLKPPPGFNFEFAGFVESNLGKLSEPIRGKKHYLLSSLGVHPKHQGKGLGTRLSQRCLDIADAAGLPIFLTAFPGARDLYLRMGFEVVREFHADLSEWTMKGKGYGIYTGTGMIRQVGATTKLESR